MVKRWRQGRNMDEFLFIFGDGTLNKSSRRNSISSVSVGGGFGVRANAQKNKIASRLLVSIG